jgi:hypothetical protein
MTGCERGDDIAGLALGWPLPSYHGWLLSCWICHAWASWNLIVKHAIGIKGKVMTDVAQSPNPADFSRNDKDGEYTAEFFVRGVLSFRIKATSQDDANRQADAELERIENEGFVEVDSIDQIDLRCVAQDRPMYRVMREGKPMQVSLLKSGDLPRDQDQYGF